MGNDGAHTHSRGRIDTAQWLRTAFVALLPVLACFLGGATAKWAEGIIVALLGIYLLFAPPKFSLGVGINIVLCALVASSFVAFLPHHWFYEPAWRSALLNDFEITLPHFLSPQPWVSAGCIASFLAALAWLYVVATQEVELRTARFEMRAFAAGIVALAALAIASHFAHAGPPIWINQRGFGPFPNRNQTANLFGIASVIVLAAGHDDLRNGRKRWIFWAAGYAIIVAGIILNFSRAGIVLVVAATALWVAAISLRGGSASRIAIAASVILILLAGILIAGGQTLERFHLHGGGGTGISTDFRWLIFRDTLQLIRSSPWCGIGLGNFEPVFAIFRDVSVGDTRALHPESDWLWLWSEMGLPAVILVLLGFALLARFVLPLNRGSNQRFRTACFIGALLCLFHGLVDVSGHRVGTAYAALFLFGLALHRPFRFAPSSAAPWIFRALGVAFIAIGVTWTVAAKNKLLLPGSIGATNARHAASLANHGRDFNRSIQLTTRALEWAPLDWQIYFVRALAEFGKGSTAPAALADFRRARFLEPNAYELPFEEGKVWLSSRPTLAVTAWREALRRAGTHRAEIYDSMLSLATMKTRDALANVAALSLRHHDLFIVTLRRVSGTAFDETFTKFREYDPSLQTLTDRERHELFHLWSERGDRSKLEELVASQPDLISFAWPAIATLRARSGDFEGASKLFRDHHASITLPPLPGGGDILQLERAVANEPRNYAAGFALYQLQVQRGDLDGAIATARHFTSLGDVPAYFNFLEGESWWAKENWERAWSAYSRFLSATPPVPPAPQRDAR